MKDNAIVFEEFDFKAAGKEAFSSFYRAHRKNIFRDKDGVEFPIFYDGNVIKQGVSVVIGYLIAAEKAGGFIGRSQLHGEWIDGFNISSGDPDRAENLMGVLSYLKQNGLKIQLTTSGKNPAVLEQILEKGLGDRVIMEVKGLAALEQAQIDADEQKKSISLATKFSKYQLFTIIEPVKYPDGQISYLAPEEIGETTKLIEEATGSKKHPYELRPFDPHSTDNQAFKAIEPMPSSVLFKYRTAARRYQVMAEIQK